MQFVVAPMDKPGTRTVNDLDPDFPRRPKMFLQVHEIVTCALRVVEQFAAMELFDT